MTRSRFSEGFNQLRRVVGRASFLLSVAVFLLRFGYFGDYEGYARWPYVQFYRDDVVLAFLFVAMGFYFVRILCTAPISAVQSVLGGFLSFEPEIADRSGFNPADISAAARFSVVAFERGTDWIMAGFRCGRWILFVTTLWAYADTPAVSQFANARPLFGSPSATGYVSALSLFALLWVLFFAMQTVALGYFEQRLMRFVGEDVAREVTDYFERRAVAKGVPPRFFRKPGPASTGEGRYPGRG